MEITYTSEIEVETIQQAGNDDMVAHAAMVSTRGRVTNSASISPDKRNGLINTLMKSRHGTPFEHGFLTIRLHAPAGVFWEWVRHRVGWSYNGESSRYKDLDPVFYIPPRMRPSIRPEDFKSIRPAFDISTDEEYDLIITEMKAGYAEAYARYLRMLAAKVDRGLARNVLGFGIYFSFYLTANPRSIMHLLELRTKKPLPEATRPSLPLYEINVAADQLENIFQWHWPITHAAWINNGRMAP